MPAAATNNLLLGSQLLQRPTFAVIGRTRKGLRPTNECSRHEKVSNFYLKSYPKHFVQSYGLAERQPPSMDLGPPSQLRLQHPKLVFHRQVCRAGQPRTQKCRFALWAVNANCFLFAFGGPLCGPGKMRTLGGPNAKT